MAGQHRLAVGARHELRDLRREEPRELAPLALDRLEQPGVRDPDRGLLGEAGRERRLAVGERADLVAGQGEDAADRAVLLDRHADQRAIAARLLALGRPVLAVGEDVVEADRLADQRDPSHDAVTPRPDRMVALPLVQLGRAARRRGDPERLAVER